MVAVIIGFNASPRKLSFRASWVVRTLYVHTLCNTIRGGWGWPWCYVKAWGKETFTRAK